MAACFLSLELNSRLGLSSDHDEYYVHYQRVKIHAIEEQEQSVEFQVGSAELKHVRVGQAIDAEYPLDALFDATQTLTDYCSPVFDFQTGEWSDAVFELWSDVYQHDILIISRLEILPPYRGHDIGLISMARLIEMQSSGCGLVVIKPFPLQFDGMYKENEERREKLGLDEFTATQSDATSKLIQHYERLGFKPLPGTDLFCLSTANCSIRPQSIALHECTSFDLPLPD